MALEIDAEECVFCGACEPVCPNKSISCHEKTFVIDAKLCSECVGFYDMPQCASVCPVDCIHPATLTQSIPIPTVKRAKLYQQVMKLINRPDNQHFT